MGRDMLRKLLWRGLGLVAVIFIGWFLRELQTGHWPDEYYVIREFRKYRGDYSYLDELQKV